LANRLAAARVPNAAEIVLFAEVFRDVWVAPDATAERLSETTMVTISPTRPARKSRTESARLPPARYNEPGEAPELFNAPEPGCADAPIDKNNMQRMLFI
jgi:hypothetical protein